MNDITPALRSAFLDWLHSGSFRGVRLGMTRAECIEQLGEPENWAGADTRECAGIYVWDYLEFIFGGRGGNCQSDPLESIFQDSEELVAEIIDPNYSLHEIIIDNEYLERFLSLCGLNFKKYYSWSEYPEKDLGKRGKYGLPILQAHIGPELIYVLNSGVQFQFWRNNDHLLTLTSLSQPSESKNYMRHQRNPQSELKLKEIP